MKLFSHPLLHLFLKQGVVALLLGLLVHGSQGSLSAAATPASVLNPTDAAKTLGVNGYFPNNADTDIEPMRQAGFHYVRVDFVWRGIESQPGVYNFDFFDQWLSRLEKRGMVPMFVMDYSNPLYDPEKGSLRGIHDQKNRDAFARFAAAAAKHYKGHTILWEIWNEPNQQIFWAPQVSASEYTALVHAVSPLMRQADPRVILLGPASSEVPFDYLETCFQQGLLKWVDAVSIHPYVRTNPEQVIPLVQKLRALMAKYGSSKPIVSSEWGYSDIWPKLDQTIQGQYLVREFLINLSLGIPVSIWYNWRDAGTDPADSEHHFGCVTVAGGQKAAFVQVQKLSKTLSGMKFSRRLSSAVDDYMLVFSGRGKTVVAAWTTGAAHDVKVDLLGSKTIHLTTVPMFY